jgi:L-Ala-D/L-Glu epimerase / N-acetyl-D-glutamate racemase
VQLRVDTENWQLDTPFIISRSASTCQVLVIVEASDGEHIGRGECSPTKRYGETIDSVLSQITSLNTLLQEHPDMSLDTKCLQDLLPPGAARNAVDCALWDLCSQKAQRPVWQLLQSVAPKPVATVYTISMDTPQAMAQAAKEAVGHSMLKLKFGGQGDEHRIAAIREAVPDQRLIVDANEAWDNAILEPLLDSMSKHGVEMVEQPLPADADELLTSVHHPMPICADESCHTSENLPQLLGKYDMVNIKLDKTGGLTEAMRLLARAQEMNFSIMVGCMLGTSLAMAPALLVAQHAQYVDLDAPLLLGKDRANALRYEAGLVYPNAAGLWGG